MSSVLSAWRGGSGWRGKFVALYGHSQMEGMAPYLALALRSTGAARVQIAHERGASMRQWLIERRDRAYIAGGSTLEPDLALTDHGAQLATHVDR